MKIRHMLTSALLALTVGLTVPQGVVAQRGAPPPPPSVKAGQMAPDFTASYLTNEGGRYQFPEVTLSELRGKKNVVLAFFPAAFSPGCTGEMARYQEQSGEFNSTNTLILGMSVDSTWANRAFADSLEVKFNILSDASREISRAYGVFDEQGLVSRRTTFIIDADGVVQKVFQAQEALDPDHALEACQILKEIK